MSATPLATALATPKPQVFTTTTTKVKQTTYIPLSGTFMTTNTDWTDVTGTDIYIDLENDYGKNTYVTFEATLKVAAGSGQTFARLYDATHGIVVDGSEVSTNTGEYSSVVSGNLPLWSGKNLYRVQIRSLNSQQATFGNGRIKVSY